MKKQRSQLLSILHRGIRTPHHETRLEIDVITIIYLILWATNPHGENRTTCQKKAHCLSRNTNQLTLKIRETLAYKYQAPRLMEKHILTSRWRYKHNFGRIVATRATPKWRNHQIDDPYFMFSYSYLFICVKKLIAANLLSVRS